jgi:hypothetical protein
MKTIDEKYGSDRRSIHSLLIEPHKQLGFAFLYIGGGVMALSILMFYLLQILDNNFTQLVPVYNIAPEAAQAMYDSLRTAKLALGILTAVIVVATFYGGIKLSHKVFGPFVPFFRQVEELKSGNYSSRIHLRDGDEFRDFGQALNDLAEHFQKKG